jgi:hypothetical protein
MYDNTRPHRSKAVTCVSSLQLDFGCPVVIAAAIPDAMLLPTDECFAQEVHEYVYDGLTCPKYALRDSNPGSWLAKEQSFESEMTILSCFLNCEGQYLKWTCFTAKTGLVILVL